MMQQPHWTEDEVLAAGAIESIAWCFSTLWGLVALALLLLAYVVGAAIRVCEACAYARRVEKLPPSPYQIDGHLRAKNENPNACVRWRKEYGPQAALAAPSGIFAVGTGERGRWAF